MNALRHMNDWYHLGSDSGQEMLKWGLIITLTAIVAVIAIAAIGSLLF